ncbi:MAG: KOW motif-containing protein [Verrucomicrobia bacterium]|nr:KOW motif-containing protein [Verrucomicrobiota bacterium]
MSIVQTSWSAFMAGGLLSIGFVFFSAVNWYWVIRGFLGMRTKSLHPFLGGFLGLLAFLLSDVPGSVRLCWIPLLLDPGSAFLLCCVLYYHFGVRSCLAACYRTIPGNRLTQRETLLQVLETRFFPYVESLGFVRDKRHEPRIVCFRRRTEIAMQIVAVIQTTRGRPGFSIEFTEAPLSGIDYEWMHLLPEDIFPGISPGYSALLFGLLVPERGKRLFRPASPWQRLFSKKRVDADGIVQRSLELFPEIIAWWECKAKGTHLIFRQPFPLPAVPKLLRALETRLFPYIESLGFVRDKRHEPRIVCFRRRTETAMQIVAIEQQTPHESPGFSIEFTEAPLSGIDYQWMHIPPEDISPDTYPSNCALFFGLLIPERGKWMFRPASPWQRLISKKRVDADGIVQRSLELFPEIIAWWECKAKGTHLVFFQPFPLPPVPSHAPVFGQPVVPTLLQNIFARNGVWRTGIYGAAAVYTLVGAILGWNLGEKWYGALAVCAIIALGLSRYFFKIFQHIRVWINGGPFRKGELVQVIAGPYAGRIAAVYEEFPSVDEVRIDLGESEWKERKDVFSHVQLCRVKPVEPEK